MKKLLILLFSLLISFNSYGEVELDFSSDTFCDQSPKVQVRNNFYYLPNNDKPYSGENLCVYLLNGQYHSRGDIKKGLREGNWEYWYENGLKERKANYKDGKLIGKTEYFYSENGQKVLETNWKDDKLDGKLTSWYENGQMKLESNFKDDKTEGRQTMWHENGQMKVEGNYKDFKEDGKWTEWNEDGQIRSESTWKDGECISGDCPE